MRSLLKRRAAAARQVARSSCEQAVSDAASREGGLMGRLKRVGLAFAGAAAFARLYFLPTKPNNPPAHVRVAAAW